MKKFPSKNNMREVKIFNPWGIGALSEDKVYIDWGASQTGRGCRCAKYQVVHIGHKTNPGGHWMYGGHKTFSVYSRDDRDAKAQEAMDWADAKYGKREWIRDPFGSYQDARVLPIIWDMVKKAEREP